MDYFPSTQQSKCAMLSCFPTFGLVFQLQYFQNMFAPQIFVHCILRNISGFQICRVKSFLFSIFFFSHHLLFIYAFIIISWLVWQNVSKYLNNNIKMFSQTKEKIIVDVKFIWLGSTCYSTRYWYGEKCRHKSINIEHRFPCRSHST